MTVYKDLFELSRKPKEVITMDEAVVHNQEQIVKDYIITSDLEDKIKKVFHNLTFEQGKGFWVQGSYGSGKSHFMSFLTVLIESYHYWNRLPQELEDEYREKLSEKDFLTVNFTLSEVENLRMKIFEEIEKAFQEKGITVYIKKDKKIVDQFFEEEYDGLKKDWFFNILSERCDVSKGEWEEHRENNNIKKLAQIIVSFKQATKAFSQKEFREVIYPGTGEGLEQITSLVEEHFDGLILFIDELSEFLQKKKDRQEESETLETLQLLGERINRAPIWIFAAVQKHPSLIVEEEIYIGDEEEKVFDRFDPLVLTEADIREIIDQRIIQKDESDREKIKKIYEELKESKPNLEKNITPKDFVEIYPFHHEFVNGLINFSTYSSRQRAAIRECWYIVNKRMNNDAQVLITVDILYNVFKEDIIYKEFKEYYDLYENVFKQTIMKPDFEYDRQLAEQTMKALLIHSIRNKKPLKAEEIGQIILADLGLGLGLSLVDAEIEDVLMYIYRETRGKGLNMITEGKEDDEEEYFWEVSPETSGISLEPEILDDMRFLNENDVFLEIPSLIEENNVFFKEFKTYNTVSEIPDSFNWHNTERKGISLFKKVKKDDELPAVRPSQDEIDFGLIMEPPLFNSLHKKLKRVKQIAADNPEYLFWIPKRLSEKTLEKLKRLTAVKKLLDDYENPEDDTERSKKMQLATEYEELSGELKKEIKDYYLSGKIVNNEFVEDELQQFTRVNELLENCLSKFMKKLYPKHPYFKKTIGRRQTNRLIKEFVIPRRSKDYTNEIENIAEPLKIVEEIGNKKYKLELMHDVFSEIEKIISDEDWHTTEDIYKVIRDEPWGLQECCLEVIFSALISSGKCRARTKSGDNLNSEKLNSSFISGKLKNKITAISKGKLVKSNIWEDIIDLLKIFEIEFDGKITIHNQNRLWKILVDEAVNMKQEIDDAKKYLLELGAELGQFEKFNSRLQILNDMLNFYNAIEEMKGVDPAKGLQRYRKEILERHNKIDYFKKKYYNLKEILSLVEERLDEELLKQYKYFQKLKDKTESEGINEIIEKFERLHNFINKKVEVNTFLKESVKIKKKYQEEYTTQHNEYHQNYEKFLEEIKNFREHKTLKQLEEIKKIEIHPSRTERLDDIKGNYKDKCRTNLTEENINDKPFCSCGFELEEKFVSQSKEKMKEIFGEGIKSYFKTLKRENYMDQIELYLKNNPESCLGKINKIESYDITGIMDLIDEKFVVEANRAFKMAFPVNISVDEIVEKYTGTISIREIEKVTEEVETYLKEKAKEEVSNNEEVNYDRIVLMIGN